jgi:serine/threonine protein kinase
MPLTSGTRLGPYEIVEPLGSGGMGEVYRARDPRLGREVAIKRVATDGPPSPDRLHRFETEARAAAALRATVEWSRAARPSRCRPVSGRRSPG